MFIRETDENKQFKERRAITLSEKQRKINSLKKQKQ